MTIFKPFIADWQIIIFRNEIYSLNEIDMDARDFSHII